MSDVYYARFNVKITDPIDPSVFSDIQKILYNAALDAYADDPEVFFDEKHQVAGVSVQLDESLLGILEAGSVLGRCQMAFEQAHIASATMWLSVYDENDVLIDSTFDPGA